MLSDEALDKLDKELEGESPDGRDLDDTNMPVLVSEVVGPDMHEWLVVISESITKFMLIWSSFAKINPATGNLLNNDNCNKLQSCTLVDKLST